MIQLILDAFPAFERALKCSRLSAYLDDHRPSVANNLTHICEAAESAGFRPNAQCTCAQPTATDVNNLSTTCWAFIIISL